MLASSQSRLSSSWDSTHHGFQTETGSGLGSLETGDNRHPPHSLTTRDSLVPGPCPVCYLPLPLLPSRELEIMSNMESILSVGQGATRALGAGRGRRLGAGDTPRGLTFWARTWDEGAVARMGRLQRPGVGFFFSFSPPRCSGCCRRHCRWRRCRRRRRCCHCRHPRMWGGSEEPVDRRR